MGIQSRLSQVTSGLRGGLGDVIVESPDNLSLSLEDLPLKLDIEELEINIHICENE